MRGINGLYLFLFLIGCLFDFDCKNDVKYHNASVFVFMQYHKETGLCSAQACTHTFFELYSLSFYEHNKFLEIRILEKFLNTMMTLPHSTVRVVLARDEAMEADEDVHIYK